MRTRRVIGAMTGTSIDGIDLALVEINGEGLSMRARLVRGRSASLGELAPRLRDAAEQKPLSAREFAALARDLGALHAREAAVLADGDPIDLVSAHGQTIIHAPPLSWQLLDPWPIASTLGCRVIADLRRADLAAGGQGAPLTPLADWVLYRGPEPRAVLNLGGFANATSLPADSSDRAIESIRGADLCVCNQLLDRAARRHLGQPFDRDGAAAARGRVDAEILRRLTRMLDEQQDAGRSLGTGDEWLAEVDPTIRHARASSPSASVASTVSTEDLLATIVTALATTIARGVRTRSSDATEVIVAGGGIHHRLLRAKIASQLKIPLRLSDELGIPADLREAAAWAVLGALAEDGVPVSLPAVTGRRGPSLLDGSLIRPVDARSSRAAATDSRSRIR